MEEFVIEQIKSINMTQLLAIGVMFWVFYNRLNNKMDKGFQQISIEIKGMQEQIHSLDKRLCRIEGILCNEIRKAEGQ